MEYIDKQIPQEYKIHGQKKQKRKQFIFKHQNILNASDYNHASDDCNVLHWRKSNNRTQKFVNDKELLRRWIIYHDNNALVK